MEMNMCSQRDGILNKMSPAQPAGAKQWPGRSLSNSLLAPLGSHRSVALAGVSALLLLGFLGLTSGLFSGCSVAKNPSDTLSLWGLVEKGPFKTGSLVTVTALTRDGEVVGEAVQSQVDNNLGYYAAPLPREVGEEAAYILVEVKGEFFNELTDAMTDGEHTLKAVIAVPSEEKEMGGQLQANVNVVTHMTHQRVIRLIEVVGRSAGVAVTEAEAELRAAFPEIEHPEGDGAALGRVTSISGGDNDDNRWLLALSCVMVQLGEKAEGAVMAALDLFAEELEYDGTLSGEGLTGRVGHAVRYMDSVACMDNLISFFDGVLYDDMIPDISRVLDTDQDGVLNFEDDDMDGDGVPNDEDCAPGDVTRHVELTTGECVADSNDWDGDGVPNDDDCAPLDPERSILLTNGECVADGPDWDGDGIINKDDCAPLDPELSILLTTGECVPDSDDWDGDGVPNDEDCAPLDPERSIQLTNGECVADSDDWDGDGVPNDEDCAPLDPERQLLLDDGVTCVADGTDDLDMDGYPNEEDCAPTDHRINPGMGEILDGEDNNCDGQIDEGWCGAGPSLVQQDSALQWCSEPQEEPMTFCEGLGCQYDYVASLNYDDAVAACAAHEGFSLPTLQQYKDLLGGCAVDEYGQEKCNQCVDSPACTAMFGEPGAGGVEKYWTSTVSSQEGAVMSVDIGSGEVSAQVKEGNAKVRCVQ